MGELIGKRYELISKLGEGGMGYVWKARDRRRSRTVAIKLLKADLRGNEPMLRRFEREWRAISSLTHQNVVRAYDYGADESADGPGVYIAMELLSGTSLRDHVAQAENRTLSVDEVIRLGRQICDALEAAHDKGLVHRDLTPRNVQITDAGQAVLLDFGIACFQEDAEGHTRITPTGGEAMGTVAYMSPERCNGEAGTGRSDLYSLGCVLYVMLTGRPPFEGQTAWQVGMQHLNQIPVAPGELRDDDSIPQELDDLVMNLLRKDPQDRPATAAEVRVRLEKIQTTRAHRGHGGGVAEPSARNRDGRTAVLTPEPVRTPERTPCAEEWPELVGACFIAGAGTFALLYGIGGVDADASLLGGVIAVGAPLFGGLAANIGVLPESFQEGTARGIGILALVSVLLGCVALPVTRADFAWFNDLFLGLLLALGVLLATFLSFFAGAQAGRSVGAGVMAALNVLLLGGLSTLLLASHQQFIWWTALLGASCVWGAALVLTCLAYRGVRT
ncbi:serine/threonine-protein kinase [Streptomyces sp. SP17KL33]|uniref:serine/threonine-protein kinase n=1 Tax=Streptomyces sp. SP17KL33 TaxID=3002534 RepID=UPI002E75E056|nr:serine/threonine-protein kinase [Streptomyces sp. SP17KL33]MEE1835309.1 serine/threonine-protein kinase [Streptomyces sp. SP17KL33]